MEKSIPTDKRLALVDNINANDDMWLHDDKEKDYKKKVRKGLFESVKYRMKEETENGVFYGNKKETYCLTNCVQLYYSYSIQIKGDEKEEYVSPAARESILCWKILRRGNAEGSFGAGRMKDVSPKDGLQKVSVGGLEYIILHVRSPLQDQIFNGRNGFGISRNSLCCANRQRPKERWYRVFDALCFRRMNTKAKGFFMRQVIT